MDDPTAFTTERFVSHLMLWCGGGL